MAVVLRPAGGWGLLLRTLAASAAALAISLAAVLAIARYSAPKGQEAQEVFNGRRVQELQESDANFRRLRTFPACAKDEQWIGTFWDYLSPQENGAWTELGWYQSAWDASYVHRTTTETTTTLSPTTTLYGQPAPAPSPPGGGYWEPASESMCYQEMSEAEQDAVRALGYSISEWHTCKSSKCSWPPGVPMPESPCLDHLVYLQQRYNYSRPWDSFSARTRAKLVTLGWDPDGVRWVDADIPLTYAKDWTELIAVEREAAQFLGYNAKTWSGCLMESSCIARRRILEDAMNSWFWASMPVGYQTRLNELGWNLRSWSEGDQPAAYKLQWDELDFQQRLMATLLGYTQDTWENCPGAPCLERFSYVTDRWAGMNWLDMKLAERRSWMLLGHSEQMWDAGRLPPTMQLRWDELTPEQQMEAKLLGHSMGTWQGCNIEWGEDVPNTTNVTQPQNPNAAVRCRMTIARPYSEVSGNVYGAQVASLPTSFIQVFEVSVARALFCGNPPLSTTPSTYLTPSGEPLCVLKQNFERQRHRVRVMDVMEGSIVVDFFFVANTTATDPTSRALFEALERQLTATTSPIVHDRDFGRFAKAATLEERPLSNLKWDTMEAALKFENLRNDYDSKNVCALSRSAKEGVVRCPTSSARMVRRSFISLLFFTIYALFSVS